MKLIVLKNNVPINEAPLEFSELSGDDEIYVGRSEDCHIRIDDPSISRHHFILKFSQMGWVFEKITRIGNIFLAGQSCERQVLKDSDEIFFGIYCLKVISLQLPVKEENNSTIINEKRSANQNDNSGVETTTASAHESESHPELPHAEDSITKDESLFLPEPVEEEIKEDSYQLITTNDDAGLDVSTDQAEENFINDQDFSSEISENHAEEDYNLSISNSSVDDESDERTQIYKSFISFELHLIGEYAPYNRYLIDSDQVLIGSDPEKCQILLKDPAVSSLHAIIKKNNNDLFLEDFNSENGITVNGEKINKVKLSGGDEFVIGKTTFIFKIISDLLQRESDRLMPVESGQFIEKEEIVSEEVLAESEFNPSVDTQIEKSIIKRILKDKNKRMTLIALILVAIIFSISSEEESKPSVKKSSPVTQNQIKKNTPVKSAPVLTKELESVRNVAYELGVSFFDQGQYAQAEIEFQKVVRIDPDYKNVQSYLEQTKVGLKKLAELEAQRRADEDRIKIKKIVEDLLIKAREAVNKREVVVAENFFSQIIEKDPENFELSQLRMELDSWKRDEEKKTLELAIKEEQRRKMLDALSPAKSAYLKKEWYSAILKLELFLKLKGIDEDLIKEAMEMLSDSKIQLDAILAPLITKARTLKEGQDMKASYEMFLSILAIDPTNREALNETDKIRNILDVRSKKIYREAIIAESLSLFSDAREKFQEVLQVSPTDSEYFRKANEKLKNYLE